MWDFYISRESKFSKIAKNIWYGHSSKILNEIMIYGQSLWWSIDIFESVKSNFIYNHFVGFFNFPLGLINVEPTIDVGLTKTEGFAIGWVANNISRVKTW